MKITLLAAATGVVLSLASFVIAEDEAKAYSDCHYRATTKPIVELRSSIPYRKMQALDVLLENALYSEFRVKPGTGLAEKAERVAGWGAYQTRLGSRKTLLTQRLRLLKNCHDRTGSNQFSTDAAAIRKEFASQSKAEYDLWQAKLSSVREKVARIQGRWGQTNYIAVAQSKLPIAEIQEKSLPKIVTGLRRSRLVPKIHSNYPSSPISGAIMSQVNQAIYDAHTTIPTPDSSIDLYKGNCQGYAVAGCSGRNPPHMWISGLVMDDLLNWSYRRYSKQTLYHELGHHFDYLYMNDNEKIKMMQIMGFPTGSSWNKSATSTGISAVPREWFAEGLSVCWNRLDGIADDGYSFAFSYIEVQPLCQAARDAYYNREITPTPMRQATFYSKTFPSGSWSKWTSKPMKFAGRGMLVQFANNTWMDVLRDSCADQLSAAKVVLQINFCGNRLEVTKIIPDGRYGQDAWVTLEYYGLPTN